MQNQHKRVKNIRRRKSRRQQKLQKQPIADQESGGKAKKQQDNVGTPCNTVKCQAISETHVAQDVAVTVVLAPGY